MRSRYITPPPKQDPAEMLETRTTGRPALLHSQVHKQLLATASCDDACEDTKNIRELKETKPDSLLDGSLTDALGVLARLQNALARLFPSNTVLLDVCLALIGLELDETHAKWQYALEKQPMARLRRYRLSLRDAQAEIEQPSGKLAFFTTGSMAAARELLQQKEKLAAMPMREAWPQIVRLHNAMQSAFYFKLVPLDVCMGLLGLEVHAEGCDWACALDEACEASCSDDEDEGESLGDESEADDDDDDDDDDDEDYKDDDDDDDEEAEGDDDAEDDEDKEDDEEDSDGEDKGSGSDDDGETQRESPPKRKPAARPPAKAAAKKQKK
eukprot:706907-Rhodomonas_salina.1